MAEFDSAERVSTYLEEYDTDVMTGDRDKRMYLYYQLVNSMKKADCIDIIVSFLMESGVKMLLKDLDQAMKRGAKIRILTGNYLGITQPSALYLIKHELGETVDLRFYSEKGRSFHPKSYIFHYVDHSDIYIGSSNISKSALTSGIEWNYRFSSCKDPENYEKFYKTFEDLFENHSIVVDDEELKRYSKSWHRPAAFKDLDRYDQNEENEDTKVRLLFEPRGAQIEALCALENSRAEGATKGIVQAATGVGKTYLAAFDSKNYQRVLFVAHREEILKQAAVSFKNVRNSDDYGFFYGGEKTTDKSVIFASVATLGRPEYLTAKYFAPDYFNYIVIDEAHHSSAATYQKVMNYFKPKLWLGMTATPDKRDDDIAGRNIYEIFHYQIAYEIRLQQAMEENMLCPFNYFGISDISTIDDKKLKSRKMTDLDFNQLTSDERVRHIIEQAEYYGYSGDRVKGLIFCSRIDESEELSQKFNAAGYRTISLNGSASEEERMNAFERLAMDEEDATDKMQPLDYIFSVEILNEGVDIVEVNQVIMLRPTESPIVFIQQLGRGLRKAEGKDYVVILDFIGNYNNNFMIPVALSGDRTYNQDVIRKYVISGNSVIPGSSTVHFDEISREKIFASIDKIKGMKSIIRSSYQNLKNRLGRVPYLMDFYDNGEVDPLVIIREYKTYQTFLESEEKELYVGKLSDYQTIILEYLSKTVLSGARPYELEILKSFMKQESISIDQMAEEFEKKYGYSIDFASLENAVQVLQGHFVSKEEEYKKYCRIDILEDAEKKEFHRMTGYAQALKNKEFYRQIDDIVEVGLRRYHEKYDVGRTEEYPFVLYEKYSRRDVSLLMNCGKDLSSTMYGMKRINDDVFIFVTYHKVESADNEKNYADGKPDYADSFEDNVIFRWDSQIGRGVNSSYMEDVCTAKRKHLFVKKSDAESNFYYMGLFDILEVKADTKKDNNGKDRDIAKVKMRMKHAVRDDLLRYLQSSIETERDKK